MSFSSAPSLVSRTAVVAGGSGFIGSYVVQELLDHGWRVRVTSRREVSVDRSRYGEDQLTSFAIDLADTEGMARVLHGAALFVHLVHSTVPAESMQDLTWDLTGTLVPTVRLLERLPADCRRVVFVSSGGTVYGEPSGVPTSEDHPTEPRSAYGAAKLTIEKYVQICSRMAGVSSAILRPSNVYGVGQRADRPQGAVAVFMRRLLDGQTLRVWGDGRAVRDFVHVADVARALRLVAEDQASGTWNVGSGVGYSLNELLEMLESVTGCRADVLYEQARVYDVSVNILASIRLSERVGWRPEISLEAGVRMLYASLNGDWQPSPTSWQLDPSTQGIAVAAAAEN